MKDIQKEFKPSSWAINNRTAVFVMTILITLAGLAAYMALPKESFPEIVIPKIYVSTVYPGTSPTDIENLVTKPIEKQIKGISGVKKMTSNSLQDYSNVVIEFSTDMDIAAAKQKVKDAVDRARADLPNDLPRDPNVLDINLSEIPIMFVNISGDYDLNRLKKYADDMKDKIESMKEITRVDLIGALDREIQVNMDMYAMQAAQITMRDVESAVGYENMTISGGDVKMRGLRRTISVKGEFTSVDQLRNLIISSQAGAHLKLGDIAEIKDGYKEQESYARLFGKNVLTLSVVKRSGENLIAASDKINELIAEMQKTEFPKDLNVTVTGDQSNQTRITLHDLINTIIIGFILVTLVLMFFMGATNALFVAMSVPLSMCIAFLLMPGIGFTLNMIVLFSFLLALGIVVDDAIVVIENTHRIFGNGKRDIKTAAKMAAGEVFLPVLSGTLTTLAPFIPLAFWKGVIGEFMFFLPITLIITLMASLLVAYIINPVFAVITMRPQVEGEKKKVFTRGMKVAMVFFALIAFLFYSGGNPGMGNFVIFMFGVHLLYRFVLQNWVHTFQNRIWPAVKNLYEKILRGALRWPRMMLFGTVGLFILTIMLLMWRKPKVEFFPNADPNFVNVYIKLPIGTDQSFTNEVTKEVESRVYKVIGKKNPLVQSVIANVTVAVTDPQDEDQGQYPNRSKVTVAFVPFGERNGVSTKPYIDSVRNAIKGIPGVQITVSQEQAGPPVPKPVNIEIRGDKFDDLVATSQRLKKYLDSIAVPGVEELKSDFESNKPQLVFAIDRARANQEGISTGQIGMEIRNAVYGKEVSKFRDANDEYPIMVRLKEDQRNDIEALRNIVITYRDMNMGGRIRNVPLSAFVTADYSNTYGGIKRKNQKRIISLSSNVLGDANPNDVVAEIKKLLPGFQVPDGIVVEMTGADEEQAETQAFLGGALLVSLGLIFIILVIQFNSFSKPMIILSEILFSVIGVLLGVAIFGMNISIVMTGVGIIALAGIVVRNGILLVEFTDLMKAEGMNTHDAIVEAGRTRLTPVILTATATILGLIPLAVGLNIDFATLFSEFNPHIYFGGDSTAFWGPLSWTMIFGLSFATFLTLILVPVMYLLSDRTKIRMRKWYQWIMTGHSK